jgi:hypothetical protein
MIFLSYSRKDSEIINTIAQNLEIAFGKENIFYDVWSIQPGDSIIGKMNEGIEKCKFFFFFVTANSLTSEMVKLEWQNALIHSMSTDTKFIPIRVDNSILPAILTRILYIDLFSYGLDVAIRQMMDVVKGLNTYQLMNNSYQNVVAYLKKINEKEVEFEIKALTYMEPFSRYIVLVNNDKDEIIYEAINEGMFESGFKENYALSNGEKFNAILMARTAPTAPGFPFKFKISSSNKDLYIMYVMRITNQTTYREIPYFYI